ncbi:MAG TPA: hypothetical protein VK864_12850, partial [Longimicrobiales bacterium]|nr:hypothetical protein [Longimicrobiales bacterium]
ERLATQLNELPALSDRGVTITAAELGEIDWSNLTLGLDAHVVWTLPFGVFTYAGAGLGLHFLNGEGTAVGDTFIEDLLDTVTAGGAAMAGAEVPFSPSFRLYGELRYTLLSDVRYPGLRIGGSYMLPTRERAVGTQGGQ